MSKTIIEMGTKVTGAAKVSCTRLPHQSPLQRPSQNSLNAQRMPVHRNAVHQAGVTNPLFSPKDSPPRQKRHSLGQHAMACPHRDGNVPQCHGMPFHLHTTQSNASLLPNPVAPIQCTCRQKMSS